MSGLYRKQRWLLLLVCVLLLSFCGAAYAANLEISGDPLMLRAENDGTVSAYRWEGDRWQHQYYGENWWGSVLVLDGDSETKRIFSSYSDDFFDDIDEKFQPVSHDKPNDWTIVTVYNAGDSGVQITQTISYTNGNSYYRKSWTIKNNSDEQTFNNLRFLHGGDAYFAGDDRSEGHWDPGLRMVYLTNENMGITGIMGFYGASSTPADHYFEGYYSDVKDHMENGQLPDTVHSSYIDSGYALQWNRDSLAPGESWNIVSYEKWTEAGYVQVLAPSNGEGEPGQKVRYEFTVANEQSEEVTYNLDAVSSAGWEVQLANTALTIAAGGSATVEVEVTVPDDAEVDTVDTLTVTATAADDETISNSDSVTTKVIPLTAGSLTVTIEPSEAVAAGAQWRRTGTATWFDSGATEEGIPVGSYTIEFKTIDNYVKPADLQVNIVHVHNTATATYNASVVPVSGISLNKTQVTLTEGGNPVTLVATVQPANATNKNLNWTSSDESVAKVDAFGKVTPLAAGTAIITVWTVDGNLTATCTVDVNAAPELPRTAGQSAAAVWGAVMLLSGVLLWRKKEN
ncbi:MAG: hypothetical protein GX150_04300 [Firmicutes bacterium]|nr:hypothetical protein [Bacillota bacterium]